MKKVMMLRMILGFILLVYIGSALSFAKSPVNDTILVIRSSDTVLEIQSDDNVICVVFMDVSYADSRLSPLAAAQANIIHQMPDAATLILLGFGGLLYRRKRK